MAAVAGEARDGNATREIVLINAAHLLTHYSLLILPTAVLAMARPGGAFGDSYGPILALATGMFVLYGVGSLPQGWLSEKFGRRGMMIAFCFGTGLSLAAAGFATSPIPLALALASAGAFAAIYHPVGTAMLLDAAGDRPGRSIGVNGVFGNFGVALAPIVTAFLAQQVSWRAAFLVPGIACLLVGLAWLKVPEVDHAARRAKKPFPEIPRHLVVRAVTVLFLVAAVSGLVFNAYTLLLPKLMEERLADDPSLLSLVGILAFAVTLCGAATQFTVGRLIDRTTLKRAFMPLALILAPALAATAYAKGWMVLPLAGIAAATIFGQVTVNETMTARYISPALRAKIYSVRFFIGFLGAAAAAPLVAILHERTGNVALAVLVLAGFAVVTLGCAVFFPDRKEELAPELWAAPAPSPALAPAPVPAE